MKAKDIFTCAALAVGLFALNVPLSAAVESDIVGYTTLSMEAGKWYQVGIPFEQLNGATTYKISEAFSRGFSDGDTLFVMDPATATYPTIRKWRTVNGVSNWGRVVAPLLQDAEISVGQAVVINKKTAGTVTLVGRVNAASQSTIQGDNAWTVVAIQHPLATTINSLKWSGIEEGDTLFIMDPSSATYPTIRKWRTVGGVSGWGRVVAPLLQDADLAVGQAMVINKKSPGTATVSFE